MTRRPLARRLALTGCLCATLALAGCTTAGGTGTAVPGTTLAIFVSVPPGVATPEAQDVILAEQLAFHQASGGVANFRLKLVPYRGRELSANARQAIGTADTIAYLGEIVPGTSADTVGITNGGGVLQVSPTDTAVELTQSTPALAGAPDTYYESLATNGRTFARMVPTDAVEARAVVAQMRSMGVGSVYVASDGSPYGEALRAAFRAAAGSSPAGAQTPSSADAIFYAGGSASRAVSLFDQAVASNPKLKLFASSALAENSFAGALSPGAQRNLYVSSPGLRSSNLTSQGRQFVSAFRAAYGHPPATEAIFGYAAMAAVIHALQRAGSSAGTRNTVVHNFFAIRNLNSVLGPFSIDKNGDINIAPLVLERVKAGQLVAMAQLQG